LGKINDNCQTKGLLDQFDAGCLDEKLLLEKELLISWSGRNTTEYLSSMANSVEEFRRSAKLRLRTLTALRNTRRTKLGHHSGTHKPGE